jgi:hypothetical protein
LPALQRQDRLGAVQGERLDVGFFVPRSRPPSAPDINLTTSVTLHQLGSVENFKVFARRGSTR